MTSVALHPNHPDTPRSGRQPPVAPEAELSVLGGCMIDVDAIDKVSSLNPDMFFREAHRRIFRAMLRLHNAGGVVDPGELADELRKSGDLEAAGDLEYLAELMDATPTAANIEYHARRVAETYRARAAIATLTEGVETLNNPGDRSYDEILTEIEGRVLQAAGTDHGAGADPLQWMKEILYPTFEEIEKRQGSPGGITGVGSGFPDLDNMTGGFQKGELTILAARPSMGKTALVVTMLLNAVVQQGVRAALFSLEMSKEQLVQRALCSEALVDLSRLLRGRLTDDDYVRLAQAAGHLNTAPLWIDDRGLLTVPQVRAACRRHRAKEGPLGMIVVDYLQLMQTDSSRENRQQEVTQISGGLKALAKENECPVIALSQLSRAPEQRSDHRPQLSDLRESGAIEQDADLVMFLYRPEYYLSDMEAQEQGVVGKTELIISKHRNGPTGAVDLFFRKESTRFESYTAKGAGWS